MHPPELTRFAVARQHAEHTYHECRAARFALQKHRTMQLWDNANAKMIEHFYSGGPGTLDG